MPKRTINTLVASSPVWTSELIVQGHQAVNISIRPGNSGGAFIQDPTLSTVSAVFTLQRKLPGDTIWRDVERWSILTATGMADGTVESISTAEVETGSYRLGVQSGEYYAGGAFCRLATR